MPSEKSIEKYKAVEAERPGMNLDDALAKHQMGAATYYEVKKTMAGKRPYHKTGAYKKKAATFIDVPLKAPASNVAVIVCNPEQVGKILEGLK